MADRDSYPRAAQTDPSTGELADWLPLARRLVATASQVRRALTGQECFSETEQLVLWHCSLEPAAGLGQSELIAAVGCSAAQMSATVESLRKAGQLQAQRSPHDRRRQRWSLTTAGLDTLAEWQPTQAAALAELSARLPAESLSQLGDLLARLEAQAPAETSTRREAA